MNPTVMKTQQEYLRSINQTHQRRKKLAQQQTYKIYTKAGDGFCVGVMDINVVLVHAEDHHETQQWYKHDRFISKARDEQGQYCFALVNKANGKVMKHSGRGEPVTLAPYNPEEGLELSVLWTESDDVGDGYKIIGLVNEEKLCMDVVRYPDGVKDGTNIIPYECWNGENQQWKITPYSNVGDDEEQRIREVCDVETQEMINFGIVGEQSEGEQSEGSVPNIQPRQLERQRLGKLVLNPLLEPNTNGTTFIPEWEITRDDRLTDALSERSIALCHQWCREIVPPEDYKELLALELKELYHWADYHKAQAHIYEMTAREKTNLMFFNEKALPERFSELEETSKQVSPKLVITTDNITILTGSEKVDAIEKLKEKEELIEKLKEQSNMFQRQLEELTTQKRQKEKGKEKASEKGKKKAASSVTKRKEKVKEAASSVPGNKAKEKAKEVEKASEKGKKKAASSVTKRKEKVKEAASSVPGNKAKEKAKEVAPSVPKQGKKSKVLG